VFEFPFPFNPVDTSFNAKIVNPAWVGNYLDISEGVKNALDFFLLDGDTLQGIKRVGLEPEAVKLFHRTIKRQIAMDYQQVDYDIALAMLFADPTDALMKRGRMFRHKR